MSTETKEKTKAEFVGTASDINLLRESYARVLLSGSNAIAEPQFHTGDIRWSLSVARRFRDTFESARKTESLDNVLTNIYIEKAERRLSDFSTYGDDWDGEGAAAPIVDSIREASSFLKRLEPWHPRPVATLNDEGYAVIEFYDDHSNEFWGSITFLDDGCVYVYTSKTASLEGDLNAAEIHQLLSNGLQITLKP